MSLWGMLLFRRGEPSEGWLPLDGRFFSAPRGVGAGEGLGEFMREVYCSLASQPTSCGGVLIAAGETPIKICQPLSVISHEGKANIPMPRSEFESTSWFSCAELIAVEGLGVRPPYAL